NAMEVKEENQVEEENQSVLQQSYCQLTPTTSSYFFELPQDIQNHIISIDRQIWFEKCQFQHNDWVNSACFNKHETLILTASCDKTARLWNIQTQQPVYSFQHNDYVRSACFNNDETQILTTSDDGTICIWNIQMQQPVYSFQY